MVNGMMLKKIRDKWKPDSVETALVYAIRLMKNLERKQQNRRGSRHNYDMAALNEMDVINIDKMKSKKEKVRLQNYLKKNFIESTSPLK